ncbi:hypothetical protein EV356DRAFT_498698 [Viridothelium virens]|uniref:Uncharacterized protein n=1 Tax=Viridothelium virens TaxID=1048519 RepID=A0A6A6HEH4_VIRVR|nr:hypothetical protein EV356DRAFT_498698 [Viridothelium virens]
MKVVRSFLPSLHLGILRDTGPSISTFCRRRDRGAEELTTQGKKFLGIDTISKSIRSWGSDSADNQLRSFSFR